MFWGSPILERHMWRGAWSLHCKWCAAAGESGMFQPGQNVRVNLSGMQAGGVMFQAAVTAAAATIVRQTAENPPTYLVKLVFSFRGVSEVEVPADRILAA
jgi:hypothetical protein